MKMRSRLPFVACLTAMIFIVGSGEKADAKPTVKGAKNRSSPATALTPNWLEFRASVETKLPPNTSGQDYNVLLPLLEQINLPKGEFETTEQYRANRSALAARLAEKYGHEFIFADGDDFDPKYHFQYEADTAMFRVSPQRLLRVVNSKFSRRAIFVDHRNAVNGYDRGSCSPYAFFKMEPSKAITIRYRRGLTLAFRGKLANVRSEMDVKQRDGYQIRSVTETGYGLEKRTTELGYGLVPEKRDTFYTILLDDMRVYLFDRKSGEIIAETSCED